MLRLLPGTFAILLTHLLLIAAFTGVGLSLRRPFGLARAEIDDWFVAFWMGFACTITFLILWNFFLPVGAHALELLLLVGGFGLYREWYLSVSPDAERWRAPRWTIALIALFALWVANQSLGPLVNWDSALYHTQGVKWAHEYRAIAGLANLYGPLGFNNSSLLYGALLDAGFWSGRSWHVVNGPLIIMFVAQAIVGGARFISLRGPARIAAAFSFLLLALGVDQVLDNRAASFRTDLPVTLMMAHLMSLWFASLVNRRRDARKAEYDLFCICTLISVCVAIKVNAAVGAALTVTLASLLWTRDHRPAQRTLVRTLGVTFGAVLLIGGSWAARGVVLSGYALFPSQLIAAPVEWRVPAEHAQAEFDLAAMSSKVTTQNTDFLAGRVSGVGAWFPNWVTRVADDPYDVVVPLVLIVLSLLVCVLARRGADAAMVEAVRSGWWIAVPLCVAMGVWFFVAPEPRYASPLFWSLAALCGAQATALIVNRWSASTVRTYVRAGSVIGFSPMLVMPLVAWSHAKERPNPLVAIVKAHIVRPAPGKWFGETNPEPLTTFTTRSGLVVNVAKVKCWDSALPCTINPAANLRLRVPGHIENGFVVDGPWEMQEFPWTYNTKYLPAWKEGRRRIAGTNAP